MVLRQLLVLMLALAPATGRAECETEAIKARQRIMASGPFEYNGKKTSQNRQSPQSGPSEQQLSGLVEPLRAHHILNGHRAYGLFAAEEIAVGDQQWIKGEDGWFQPMTFFATSEDVLPHPFSGYVVSARCLGSVVIEGKSLVGYELQYKSTMDREQVFVEPATGLTVRMEQFDRAGGASVISFRYDASIRIEPPKVEADAPKLPEFIHFGKATRF